MTGEPTDCTLESTYKDTLLSGKLPVDYAGSNGQVKGNKGRHTNGRIDVAFCDGHAEGIGPADYGRVRISPYHPVDQTAN